MKSNQLSDIVLAINESKYILNLEYDWDSEGALPVPKFVWQRATYMVYQYSEWVFNNHGIFMIIPTIDACADGSIDIMWHGDDARILINVRNSDITDAYVYMDNYRGKNKISYNMHHLDNFDNFFKRITANLIQNSNGN